MSSRNAKVKIGATWLTHDGSAGGRLCKATVLNESAFASAYTATSEQALNFTVHTQVVNRGVKGIEFAVRAEYLAEDLLAAIITQLSTAFSSGASVRVVVDSLTDFDVMAMPVTGEGGALYTFESRSGGFAKNVQFKFISTGAGA